MKIGVSTACFYPLETEKAFLQVAQSGVPCTEIFFNALSELEYGFLKHLTEIQKEYNTNVVSIHPTMSLAESFMLFSAYERRFYEGLEDYKRYGEVAAILGAEYVVMHGGKPNGVLDDEQYCERYIKISEAVGQSGVTLLQENVAKFRAGDIEFLKNMVRFLGEKVNFCLDVKQCIRGGYTPFDVISAVGKNIRHLHISDSNETNDCMLPLKGNFNFKNFFDSVSKTGYSGSAVIEVYRQAYDAYFEIFDSCRILSENLRR